MTKDQRFHFAIGAFFASFLTLVYLALLSDARTFWTYAGASFTWLVFMLITGWEAAKEKRERSADTIRTTRAIRTYHVAESFSKFPSGRTLEDGPESGEALRKVLHEILKREPLIIDLSGTLGFSSSFLEGCFKNFGPLSSRIAGIHSADPSIVQEVWDYLLESVLFPRPTAQDSDVSQC